MIKNFIKVALRHLRRRPGFTASNIAGLTLGLSVFILILLFVRFEFSFDRFNKSADQIYRVEQDYGGRGQYIAVVHNPLGPALQSEFPEITANTRLMPAGNSLITHEPTDNKFSDFGGWYAEPTFLEMFSYGIRTGDPESMLSEPFSLVLTEQMAKQIFNDEDPIGQTLTFNSDYACRVTGLLEDCPENSQINFDFLVSASSYEKIGGEDFFDNWNRMNVYTYILLQKNAGFELLNEKIDTVLTKFISEDYPSTLYLKPMTSIHLYSDVIGDFGVPGDLAKIRIMLAIGVFILIIACINFMNMSTAQSVRRAREVGIRKVVGAWHKGLVAQFLLESVIIAFISLLLAVTIVYFFLPEYNLLVNRELSLHPLLNLKFASVIVGLTLLTGLIAGSWPAFYLSSFRPLKVLKGLNMKGTGSSTIRKILVTLQFSISIVLIAGTWVIKHQTDYLKNKNPGYEKEGLINLTYHNKDQNSFIKFENFRNELMRNSDIKNASISNFIPGFNGALVAMSWEGADEGETAKVNLNFVDTGFINTYQIKMLTGRNFTPSDFGDTISYFMMNQAAAKRFRWDEPVGKRLANNSYAIGLMEDFHFGPLNEVIEPIIVFPIRNANTRFNDRILNLTVKSASKDAKGVIENIESVFTKHFPDLPFECSRFEEGFLQQFRDEVQLTKTIGYFSAMAVFIACLGLLSLAAYLCESRKKEMALRKIMGASVYSITSIFAGEFIKWLVMANLIAWPVAWYLMKRWLEDFPYHQSIQWWIFPVTGLITVAIAFGTTLYQSIRSARLNPSKVLKYE